MTTSHPLKPLTRVSFLAAPALLALYGLVRLIPGSKDPGAGWAAGHLALLLGLALFAPVFLALRGLAPATTGRRFTAALATPAALAGLLASVAQAAIDLVIGFRAHDRAGMDELFGQVQQHAAVKLAVYSVGPLLFYVGLLALLAAATTRRGPVGPWALPLVLLGIVLSAVDLDLMPLGSACFLLALAPIPSRALRAARPLTSSSLHM